MTPQTSVSSFASLPTTTTSSLAPGRLWRVRSLGLILLPWLVLQAGGLFSPGLLDDVDSIYIQVAREMLHRHDFVTPTIDGIRFFDKPPLMYWLAAASMRIFGEHDWAARLPLALGVLGLLVATYALGVRLYAKVSPELAPDRGGLYAALAMATSIGPYLYTRFYIPDILIALWMTLSMLFLLQALDRLRVDRSALWPCLGFAAVTALNLLTKGLIGVLFPLATVLLFLALTHRLKLLARLHLVASTAVFLLIAAPWHILAALRNPAVAMPAGLGLPARAGWAWFYLYNEHLARFLGRRIPHDYGQVPIPLFWLLLFVWLLPWAAFLPAALRNAWHSFPSDAIGVGANKHQPAAVLLRERLIPQAEGPLLLLLWAGIILGFFTLSSRQEYYHLPALPALALLVGGLLAKVDRSDVSSLRPLNRTRLRILLGALILLLIVAAFVSLGWGLFGVLAVLGSLLTLWSSDPSMALENLSKWLLVPLGACLFLLCTFFAITAPVPRPGVSLDALLSSNPEMYNLSLGHIFDLTGAAMGFFRLPLLTVGVGMLLLGPGSHLLRRSGRPFAANLLLAGAMVAVLLAVHEGLRRFYPILGSKELAQAIEARRAPGDRVLVDGELTAGSTLLFYTNARVDLVNGHVNGPWFGSFWPDAPNVFVDQTGLDRLWSEPARVFLLTYEPQKRTADLARFGPVTAFASSGGKTVLTNRR